jgi:predicted  nucleic acid-binding Zn-ribbon protein
VLNFHPASFSAPGKAVPLEINEVLTELIEMQRLDSGLDELDKVKKRLLNDIAVIDTNVQLEKNKLQDEKKGQEELVKSRKALEMEMGTLESRIKKYTSQQNDVKNNDQVTALSQEVDKDKLEKTAAEEKILDILFQEDEQKAKVQTLAKKISDEEKRAAEAKNEIQQKITDCDKAVSDKRQERDRQLTKIEEPYASSYERLRKAGKKTVVAHVTEDNTCSGCNMNVAPQMFNEIRKKIAITTCQCGRYLYIKD